MSYQPVASVRGHADPRLEKGVNNSWVAQLNTSALERTAIEDQVGSGMSWWYNYFTSQRARFAAGTGPGVGFTTAMTGANLDGTWTPITDAEYIPMILAPAHNNATENGWLSSESSTATKLLGPTEPDIPTNDAIYSGWAVADVLTMWGSVMEPWRAAVAGRRLGAPAVSQVNPVTTAGLWFDQFMQGVVSNGYHVDFIPVHFFFNYTGAGLATGTTVGAGLPVLRAYLRDIWNLYRRPLWPELGILQTLGNTDTTVANANERCVELFKSLAHEMGQPIVERWNFWPLGPWGSGAAGAGLYAADGTINAVGTTMKRI
jgi:hypothetical protein